MPDLWTETPASGAYPGMTRLTRAGRTFAFVGTGPAIRAAIERHINQTPGSASVARRPAARTKAAAGQPNRESSHG